MVASDDGSAATVGVRGRRRVGGAGDCCAERREAAAAKRGERESCRCRAWRAARLHAAGEAATLEAAPRLRAAVASEADGAASAASAIAERRRVTRAPGEAPPPLLNEAGGAAWAAAERRQAVWSAARLLR